MLGERYQLAAKNLLGSDEEIGGTSERALEAAEKRFGIRLPLALREYYSAVGLVDSLNDAHNQLLNPCDLFLDGDKIVFMLENQVVLHWGVEAEARPLPDPPVFQGINDGSGASEWYPEHDQCSTFLLVMMHWQAVLGGLEYGGSSETEQLPTDYFERHWTRVGEWQEIVAYSKKGKAICTYCDETRSDVYAAARSEELFEELCEELRGLDMEISVF